MFEGLINSLFISTKASVFSRIFSTAISIILYPLTVALRAYVSNGIDSISGINTVWTVIISAIAIVLIFASKTILMMLIRKSFRKFIAIKFLCQKN